MTDRELFTLARRACRAAGQEPPSSWRPNHCSTMALGLAGMLELQVHFEGDRIRIHFPNTRNIDGTGLPYTYVRPAVPGAVAAARAAILFAAAKIGERCPPD